MRSLRHMALVCLLVPCLALCAQSRNPYNLELQNLQSAWPSASKLEKLVILSEVQWLRDYVDDPAQIQKTLESLGQSGSEDALIKTEAAACLDDVRTFLPAQPRAQHWYEAREMKNQVLAEAGRVADSGNAAGFATLAELEHMAGVSEALDHMLQAAQLAPAAARWKRVAEFSDDPLRKFAALQSGLALEPENAALNLQLADYYIGRQQLEKARDLLNSAIAAAPDDFVLRERRAALYLHLGLRSAALEELRLVEKQWTAPLWLRERLALDYEQLGLLDAAARLAASVVAEKFNDREQLELLARFHEHRHMKYDFQADYLALSRLEPNLPGTWSRLAQVQADCGDLAGAKASLLRLIALDGGNAEAHRRLSEVYRRLNLANEAQQELAAASGSAHAGTLQNDVAYLVNPQAIIRAAIEHPPQAADVVLADIRVQELLSSGLDRLHVQQIFFIGTDAAVDAHRVTSVRYSPGADQLTVLRARLWKKNGAVLEAQELGDRDAAEDISMYYDMRARQLRFAGLEKGDFLELEYSIAPTTRTANGYFGQLVLFSGHNPVQLKRYVLLAPAEQKIFVHTEKVAPAIARTENSRQVFVWEFRALPALPHEPHSPGITEISPYVHVSTAADWKQLGSWYADLIRPQFALDSSLQSELQRILQEAKNDREKIAAVQEFVVRSTHYVALEFGIYSYKPYPVSQIYTRRFGDCKDKASLMIAMLRAAGIEAEIALVRTRSLGDVAESPASIAVFNHAIVYVPKYELWLDGTAEYAGRELPLEDQGALALTVNLSGAAQLRRIPMSRAADNYTRHTIQATLSPSGMIQFHGSTVTRGEEAPGLRHELAVPEQQLDIFRRELAEVFPTVQVDRVAVRGAEELSRDVSVEFQGALTNFRQKPVVSLSSSWMPRSYVAALAMSSTRTQDLVLSSPWSTEEEIHIALPEGAEVTTLPRDQNLTSSFGSVRLHYKKSGGQIVIQSRVEFEKARVNAQDYPAFRQFCAQVERSFRNEITVSLPQ
jgi:transglutaminase-like putative cysteine protease/lipopolysaccharide biosynthesis regulator YciM